MTQHEVNRRKWEFRQPRGEGLRKMAMRGCNVWIIPQLVSMPLRLDTE